MDDGSSSRRKRKPVSWCDFVVDGDDDHRTESSTNNDTTNGLNPEGKEVSQEHLSIRKTQKKPTTIIKQRTKKQKTSNLAIQSEENALPEDGSAAHTANTEPPVATINPTKQNGTLHSQTKKGKGKSNEHGHVKPEWSEARKKAFECIHSNPNSYYFRFNAPGETPRTGPWSSDERALFFKRMEEFGVNGQWGLFSTAIPGRVGYQCLNFLRKLVLNGEVQAPPGFICNDRRKKLKSSKDRDEDDDLEEEVQSKARARSRVKSPRRRTQKDLQDEFDDSNEDEQEEESENEVVEEEQSSTNTPKQRKSRDHDPPPLLITICSQKLDLKDLDICVCGSSGQSEQMLGCCDCGEMYHFYCGNIPQYIPESKKPCWRCPNCKCCEVCKDPGNEDKLLVCDKCDQAYHTFCLTPPLNEVPETSWLCTECAKCALCGSTSPGGPGSEWMCGYSLCSPCGTLFTRGNYCIVCERVIGNSDPPPVVQCDSCSSWVHLDCDNISDADFKSSADYSCPKCRKVPIFPGPVTLAMSPAQRLCGRDQKDVLKKIDLRQCCLCHKYGDRDGCKAVAENEQEDTEVEGRLLPLEGVDSWVHANCALWSDDVEELITGSLHHAPKVLARAKNMTCTICNQLGASISCFSPGCKAKFHIGCAFKSKYHFSYFHKLVACTEHTKEFRISHPESDQTQGNLCTWPLDRKLFIFQKRNQPVRKPANVPNQLPIDTKTRVGSISIENIGEIVSDPGFHDEDHIFPSGYKTIRRFWDVSGAGRTSYVCEVFRLSGRIGSSNKMDISNIVDVTPMFSISWEGCLQKIIGTSAPACFSELIQRINQRRAELQLPCINEGHRGTLEKTAFHFFGLSEPWILKLMENIPQSVKCESYRFKFTPVTVLAQHKLACVGDQEQMQPTIPENPSGCARTEGFSKSKKDHVRLKSVMDVSGNAVPDKKLNKQTEEHLQFKNTLPATMKYRLSKEHSHLRVMKSAVAGLGLYSTKFIPEGDVIIEYIGEIIGKCVADKREKIYEKRGLGCYMFKITDDEIIDATLKGNKARFINHSCDPNAYTRIIKTADGTSKIVVIAKRGIEIGEEICYDYQFPIEDNKIHCGCGSSKCIGTMN